MKALPGSDFSSLLANPERAGVDAVRPGVLFNYVGLSTIDGDYLRQLMIATLKGITDPPVTQVKLNKRGLVSFVFDGRYKFARYYAPSAFNTPQTLEEILKNNDVQLFDLETDPAVLWREFGSAPTGPQNGYLRLGHDYRRNLLPHLNQARA